VLAETTWRLRRAIQAADDLVVTGRYVDMGVRLHVVRQHESGAEVIAGLARVASVGVHEYGGMLDTRTRKWVGKSETPAIWYASEAQWSLLDKQAAPKQLVYGAMGAGKTRVMAPWLLLRAFELTGYSVELGGTAPTTERLSMLVEALTDIMPKSWYTWRAKERLFLLRNGVRIRLVATTPRSAALGSPVQGWSWAASASDELQDSLVANADIEARGRRAPDGIYRRFCTATAKDSPSWREARDRFRTSPNWSIHRLDGYSNAFVHRRYWESLKEEYDERTYRRLVLAQDVGPERAVYPAWQRDENIRPVPQVGAKDITKAIVHRAALLGHDPGQLYDVTLVLKCYQIRDERHWYVVDELTTKQTTTEQHVIAVTRRLRERWDMEWDEPDSERVIVRCDPYGDSDTRTDRSVYTVWKNAGYKILSAAYNKQGQGKGRVSKDAGIEMVNRLLCAASGKRSLFVACDDNRKPAAPRLVEAIEMSERDEQGKAETQSKGEGDMSHWCAALRYALWPYERVRDSRGVRAAGALS